MVAATTQGWARWACPRVLFFYLFYSINRGGHATASEKVLFTVTFDPPRIIDSARLAKVLCSSVCCFVTKKCVDDRSYTYNIW
jgi:hypothetical protein